MYSIKKHWFISLFLISYFLVIAYKLIANPVPFYDWDESINAEVGKEMIEQKSLIPLWQGKVWLDKPPLPFLFYGFVMKLVPGISPEISLRMATLILTVIALALVYKIFYKASGDVMISFVTVTVTSFTPIVLQRSHILNLDVFLLLGWIGYLLFHRQFYLGLFFLSIAVLTKSLIGFYPVAVLLGYYFFLFFIKKIGSAELKKMISGITVQVLILSSWYLIMLFIFKGDFIKQHIIETHFKRVAASIESHFGKRTYYIDLMMEQLGIFVFPVLLGATIVILNLFQDLRNRFRTKSGMTEDKAKKYLYALFLLPWFLFLNLTKTKIFWYLYPAIPQFAYFAAYPLILLSDLFNRFRIKYGMTIVGIIIVIYIFHQNFIQKNFFSTYYSGYEDHYYLASYARDRCDSLTVLVGKDSRDATNTLENMGLTITSSKLWGDHPSIVYYFGKIVNFIYDQELFKKRLLVRERKECYAVQETDLSLIKDIKSIPIKVKSYYLF